MPQVSGVGDGNVIVQISGEGNSVQVGLARLTLTCYLMRGMTQRDLDWLSLCARAVPLIGREDELGKLARFVHSDRAMSPGCLK